MELVSPAGGIEKLRYAFRYGADAAYIGLRPFSLRSNSGDIDAGSSEIAPRLKEVLEANGRANARKLYLAVNIHFHGDDLAALEKQLPDIAKLPADAFIVSDLGAYSLLRERFPDAEFHLSTQANCTNPRAAKLYRSLGFSRIVPGRELSLDEIKAIKDAAPELEIEAFVHGAMCMAYSGRCFISSWTTGRSANAGDCAHSCRWKYRVYLEEQERPGQLFPVDWGEGVHGGHTLLMSSRDLCMIDHLEELRAAGVDAVKIEGRMKSEYYTALVTQAYRWGLDHPGGVNPFAPELDAVSHREYDTGFYLGRGGMDTSTTKSYRQTHLFLGSFEESPLLKDGLGNDVNEKTLCSAFWDSEWSAPLYLDIKNSFSTESTVELLGPEALPLRLEAGEYRLFGVDGQFARKACHGSAWFFQAKTARLGGRRPETEWLLRKPILEAEI